MLIEDQFSYTESTEYNDNRSNNNIAETICNFINDSDFQAVSRLH